MGIFGADEYEICAGFSLQITTAGAVIAFEYAIAIERGFLRIHDGAMTSRVAPATSRARPSTLALDERKLWASAPQFPE